MPLASAEEVGVAWAKSLDLAVGQGVATTVPDFASWSAVATGTTSRAFLQVIGTGGGMVRDTPLRSSVLSFDCWAARSSSDRPPLGLASAILADLIRKTSGYSLATFPVQLTLTNGAVVIVDSAWRVNDHPRRIPDQDTSRAHYSIDIELMWKEIPS